MSVSRLCAVSVTFKSAPHFEMRSLFFRVLALLLGSFVLVLIVSFGLFWWINQELNPEESRLHHRSRESAEELVDATISGNAKTVLDHLHSSGVRAWVLDQADRPIIGPPVPASIMRQVTHYPMLIRPYQNAASRRFIFSHQVERDQSSYRVILSAGRGDRLRGTHRGIIWFPILVVLLGLVIASILLSHWVLRPLRTFRQTASSISGDSLAARIPEGITERRDAFGELGREFNRMTARVERSIDNQKQLLRDVSHELRSPLARIQVAASLSNKKHGKSAEIDRIESEVNRLDSLIEDLLSLSKLQAGTDEVFESVNLGLLLNKVCEDANFEFQSSQKQVKTFLQSDLFVRGNFELLTSAFENVIRNALRFSPESSTVEVSATKKNQTLEISVTDQGPGVNEEFLLRIFDPFFKADHSRTEFNGQHGIGLALSRAIVELHRGSIIAQNKLPSGLVVRISLPFN